MPDDYNTDGRTEVAVFRPSQGVWYVAGGATTAWGTSGDVPVRHRQGHQRLAAQAPGHRGTVTHLLEAYAGEPIAVLERHEVLDAANTGDGPLALSGHEAVLRRRVLLRTGHSWRTLVYANPHPVPRAHTDQPNTSSARGDRRAASGAKSCTPTARFASPRRHRAAAPRTLSNGRLTRLPTLRQGHLDDP